MSVTPTSVPSVPRIFLNYRVVDEPFGVALLDAELSRRYGSAAVFLASKSIPLGSAWEHEMLAAVESVDAVLVIMGRNWLTARDATGRMRLNDPADYVRREILLALEKEKQVIPVRFDAPRLSVRDLPEELAGLAGRQDVEVRFRSAGIDIDRLADRLEQLIPGLRPEIRDEVPDAGRFVTHQSSGQVFNAHRMEIGSFHAGTAIHNHLGPEARS